MIQTVPFKSAVLRYRDEGEGNVLVLIHGFPEALEIWDEMTTVLSKRFRIVTPDLPGFGASTCLSDTHSMELMAESVKAVLDSCGISTCVIAGHSMGGYVTLAFAERFPEMIKGICLFHSAAHADSKEKKAERSRTIEAVKQNRIAFLSEFTPRLFAPPYASRFTKEIDAIKALCQETALEGITSALAGMRDRKDRTDILKRMDKPVLFILGKHDAVLPYDTIINQAILPVHAEILVLEKAAHMGFIEAKKETTYALDRFTEFCYL